METENPEIKDNIEKEYKITEEKPTAELQTKGNEDTAQQNNKRELTQDQVMRKSLKVSYAIRTIAGFYLLYVAFQMFRTMDLNTGGTKLVSNMFMIFFAIVGLVMIITSLNGTRKLMK